MFKGERAKSPHSFSHQREGSEEQRKVDFERIVKLYEDGKRLSDQQRLRVESQDHRRQESFERVHRRESHSPKCENHVSSRIIKELRR